MKIRRINVNTISCIISPEDMREHGFGIEDFFERKKEAVDFIRSVVLRAAISENFNLEGELTTMRVSVLPDHSLSLLITREDSQEGASKEIRRIAQSIFEAIAAKAAEKEKNQEEDQDQDPSESLMRSLLAENSSDRNRTKAGEDGDGSDGIKESGTKQKNSGTEDPKKLKKDAFMFSFYTVRDAMNCCRLFAAIGAVKSSFYYLREDDVYFLILRRTAATPPDFDRLVLSANEFGELVTSHEQFIAYVTEHGICIAKDNAVSMLLDAWQEAPNGKKKGPRKRKVRTETALTEPARQEIVQEESGQAETALSETALAEPAQEGTVRPEPPFEEGEG